jgi:2'-5' RNA ligase
VTGREYCFWLVPAEPLKAQLTAIIEKFVTEQDAVSFTPHVTLYVGPSNDDEARGIAARLLSRQAPVTLKYEKLDATPFFYKTLFVQFAESAEARKLSEAIRAACAMPSTYTLNPHLSLMYKKIHAALQAQLCRTLDVPKGVYTFDRLCVTKTGKGENKETVRRWRTVYNEALKG